MTRHTCALALRHWPPYLGPGWIALYLAGALAWWTIAKIGGLVLVALVAAVGVSLAVYAGWWLHTWSQRNAKLPRARARRNRGRR